MVCYAVPLVAMVFWIARRRVSRSKGREGFWLTLMLFGGAIFGFIDHLWNGELFLMGNWMMDLSLGFTITGGIFGGWGLVVFKDRITGSLRYLNRRMGAHGL